MRTLMRHADSLLRGSPWATASLSPASTLPKLLALIAIFGAVYGAIMGGFGGVFGDRLWQVVYSAVKVPLLLLATFAISLPSYFVLNTLLGVRSDFGLVVRSLAATQAGLTVILASLAPYTLFWYASSADYEAALLFNGLMFGFASITAQVLLVGFYRPLVARSEKHRWLLRIWVVLYAFVGIQMAWVLRPFVGDPNAPTEFFREDSWGNAYEVVFRLLLDAVMR